MAAGSQPGHTSSASRPEDDAGAAERPSSFAPWRDALAVVVGTRILFFLIGYAASFLLSSGTSGVPDVGPFDIWNRWDATRFLTTADNGYEGPGSFPNAYAFFPFFPMAIRMLGWLGLPSLAAGFLISAIGSWVGLAFLWKLAEEEVGEGTGRRAVLYAAVFPTAVFLIAPYSESLFLAGAIPAFYFARRRRWELVGPFAALAMGTRFAGVFLLLGLFVEALRQRDLSPKQLFQAGLSLVIGMLPLLGYAAYLAQVKNDPFYFVTEQRLGWGRSFVGPISALTNTIDRFDDPTQSTNFQFAYRIEIVAAAVGVLFVLWAIKKREWGYAVYMGTVLLVLLTSTEYFSIPRILLTFFPVAVFMARATLERPLLHDVYLALSTTAAAVGVVVYTRGSWFF